MVTRFSIVTALHKSEMASEVTERASHLNQSEFLRNMPNRSSLLEWLSAVSWEVIRESENFIHSGWVVNLATQAIGESLRWE